MDFSKFSLDNNGKKEQLKNIKNGVRKELVDKKFHNLFGIYDINHNGTIETKELEGVFKGLGVFSQKNCADNVLDSKENEIATTIFSDLVKIDNADFMGFIKSLSSASENIVSTKETNTEDGGKLIKTTYADGSTETICYYPDGEYKYRKYDYQQNFSNGITSYSIVGQFDKFYTENEIEEQIKKAYDIEVDKRKKEQEKFSLNPDLQTFFSVIPNYEEFKTNYINQNNINPHTEFSTFEQHEFDVSERASKEIETKNFILSHYIETHQDAKDALATMGILDKTGALLNAGAEELWNSIKNIWNGTKEEYENFYDLAHKFDSNYNKVQNEKLNLDKLAQNPEMFFSNFETSFPYNPEVANNFKEVTERYQNAQILDSQLKILDKTIEKLEKDITNDILGKQGAGMAIDVSALPDARELLTQYLGGNEEAVHLILWGENGKLDVKKALETVKRLKDSAEKLNMTILGGKTLKDLQDDYRSQYKQMYGTDFCPDDLNDKINEAKMTGGMAKIGILTIVSILVMKSPAMQRVSLAASGVKIPGTLANFTRSLASTFGKQATLQAIKFAMSTGTLASDIGLTLLNQITSERGVDGEELLESTKSSAKYIYFGAYIGGPLAQVASKSIGKLVGAKNLLEGATKTANQTSHISGSSFLENLKNLAPKAGAFLTEISAFAGLEMANEGINLYDALSEQGEMLSKLKIMNHVLEYMLGAKTHVGLMNANLESAIEKSGVKKWNIIETNTSEGIVYNVDVDGVPIGKYKNSEELTTAMIEKVAQHFEQNVIPSNMAKAPTTQNLTEISLKDFYQKLADKGISGRVYILEDGHRLVKLETGFFKNDYYEFDSNGRLISLAQDYTKKDFEKYYDKYKNISPKKCGSSSGTLNVEILLGDLSDSNFNASTAIREEITNATDKTTFEQELKSFEEQLCTDIYLPSYEREWLLRNINAQNIEIAKQLYADQNFPNARIYNIIQFTNNNEMFDFMKQLFANKDISKSDIELILKNTTSNNIESKKELLANNNNPKYNIGRILIKTNSENIELAKLICLDKDFPTTEIGKLLSTTNKDNIEFAKQLFWDKDFPKFEIANIINDINKDNIELAKQICSDKDFPTFEIARILKFTNKDNIELAKQLCSDNDFPKNEIARILKFTNKDNIEFAKLLCSDKDFPKFEIANIINDINKDNIEFAKQLCSDKDFPKNEIANIINDINKDNIEFAKQLCSDKDFPKNEIARILKYTNKDNIEFAKQLCSDKDFPTMHISSALRGISYVSKKNLNTFLSTFKNTFNNPDLFVNGEYKTKEQMQEQVIVFFFVQNTKRINSFINTFDKETLNTLLRKRFNTATEYLHTFQQIENHGNLEYLQKFNQSCNQDGKPFLPTQKIDFINLIDVYKTFNMPFDKMNSMLETGRVNLGELKIDLFNSIMKTVGLTEEEIASIPKDKLVAWDLNYMDKLAIELSETNSREIFNDLIKAGNFEPDFKKYINDPSNPYGKVNQKTKSAYQDMNMNYDKWLNPSKENEIHFTAKDKNTEQLSQISAQITEDMNELMKTSVKGFLAKQFPKLVQGDNFVLPKEYIDSKTKLEELLKILSDTSEQGQLTQLWKRAQNNKNNPNPDIAQRANNTLTILNHLNQRLEDISKVQKDNNATNNLDLTIKMWDRIPQKDLFQGNYSTCCIGMNEFNASAMPHFIMDTAYNMIELVDNTSGETIGNALCYFVKGQDGKPAFIIDNIEIRNSNKPSSNIGIQLRNAMTQYAEKIAKDVTGSDDVPIYMSDNYNDVPTSDLKSSEENVSFIGSIDCDLIYMDLFEGWRYKDEIYDQFCNLLRLK